MPIYEYRCDNCGHELETIQKVSEEPLKRCPACEQDSLRKRISKAAFRLKGGGWYETDFKSDKKRNVAGDEKSSDSAKSGAEGNGADARKESKSGEKAADGGAGSGKSSTDTPKKSGESGKSGGEGKSTGSPSKSKPKSSD